MLRINAMSEFKKLHQNAKPLLLANVWDAVSAKCAQEAGYQALGTSSAAIANLLGYEDGEHISFNELAFMVQRIASASLLPLSVDIEAGFSRDPVVIVEHIQQLAELGVVGINIEDSLVDKERILVETHEFTNLLSTVCAELAKRQIDVFINVRCDTFLLGVDNVIEESIKRAQAYQRAGADGLFFPCITQVNDIEAIIEQTSIPVNVMAMPELPDFKALAELGVKRISTGNFAHETMTATLRHQLLTIKEQGSSASLFT